MQIKKLTLENMEEIVSSFIDTFNRAPWNDSWNEKTALECLTDYARAPKYIGYYALSDEGDVAGAILGRNVVYSNTISFQVEEMYVHEKYHRRGIGTKLFNAAVEDAQSKGAQGVFLSTQKDIPAFEFYKKMGLHKLATGVLMYGRLSKNT